MNDITQIDVELAHNPVRIDVYVNGERLLGCKEITIIDQYYRVSNRREADVTASYDVPSDRVHYVDGKLIVNNPTFDEKHETIEFHKDLDTFEYPEMGTIEIGKGW